MTDEDLTNEVIALLWPLLDEGWDRDRIMCVLTNVLDSWEPEDSGSGGGE